MSSVSGGNRWRNMSALGEVKGSCEVDSPVSFAWPQIELGSRSTFSVPGSP